MFVFARVSLNVVKGRCNAVCAAQSRLKHAKHVSFRFVFNLQMTLLPVIIASVRF